MLTVKYKPPVIIQVNMLVHFHGASSSVSFQFTLLRCCLPEQRMFRASSSSVLFHFMLLLGLAMAAVTLGFNFYLNKPNAYADVSTHQLEVNTLLNLRAFNLLFLPFPAALNVGGLKMGKRCLIS